MSTCAASHAAASCCTISTAEDTAFSSSSSGGGIDRRSPPRKGKKRQQQDLGPQQQKLQHADKVHEASEIPQSLQSAVGGNRPVAALTPDEQEAPRSVAHHSASRGNAFGQDETHCGLAHSDDNQAFYTGGKMIAKVVDDEEEADASEAPAPPALSAATSSGSDGSALLSSATFASTPPPLNSAPPFLDIWHPEYWTSQGAAGDATKGTDILRTKETERATISSSSESDNDDADEDLSDLSDITGLTGFFDNYQQERRLIVHGGDNKDDTDANHLRVSSHSSKGGTSMNTQRSTKATSFSSRIDNNQRPKKASRRGSRKVSFDSVQVRHYERIMCDNPASAGGPSIGIGWNFHVEGRDGSVAVDDFELARRRKGAEEGAPVAVLSRDQREKIIRSLGYTEQEIASTVRHLNRLRYLRRQTVNNLNTQKVEEAVESAARQVKKIFVGGWSKAKPVPDFHSFNSNRVEM